LLLLARSKVIGSGGADPGERWERKMIVSHLGRFSIIFTAKRQPTGWQGCARIKPGLGAPEPFTTEPTYLSSSTYRSEALAEAAVQKEVTLRMRKHADEQEALSSLVAESGMRPVGTDGLAAEESW